MKTGKRSENGRLRPVDSQKESSTGALEGTVGLGSRGGRVQALLLLPSSRTDRHTSVQHRQSSEALHSKKGMPELGWLRGPPSLGGAHVQMPPAASSGRGRHSVGYAPAPRRATSPSNWDLDSSSGCVCLASVKSCF